jgi:hypothetical protein
MVSAPAANIPANHNFRIIIPPEGAITFSNAESGEVVSIGND